MKRFLNGLVFLFLALSAARVGADVIVDMAQDDFKQATDLYRQGKYKESIDIYEQILSRDMESGPIHYNLGNAYFKNNKLGKTVLEYERALRLTPYDRDVQFNLQHALDTVKGPKIAEKNSWVADTVNRCSFDGIIGLLGWILFLSGSLFVGSYYMRWLPIGRKVLIGISVILILCLMFGLGVKIYLDRGLSVIMSQSDARFEPRKDATTYFTLYEGTEVRVKEEQDGWSKIERMDGKSGWVETGVLEKVDKSKVTM
ncbi:MAG: SH3 domain-containing protein [Candidatus Omnitrophica bacterium]|nr:SH3 domain-containing protein [Candidatus Omnitrophota bacterium]